jgi:hypothetical protein
MAWRNLFDIAMPRLSMLPSLNLEKLVKGVGVGNRDIKSNNWAYLNEMEECFFEKLPSGEPWRKPVLLFQGRPPGAISSLDSRVKADRLMRKHMWARASECSFMTCSCVVLTHGIHKYKSCALTTSYTGSVHLDFESTFILWISLIRMQQYYHQRMRRSRMDGK